MFLPKYKYWRELELLSITTIMNVVTFVQFAIVPLNMKKEVEQVVPTEQPEAEGLTTINVDFIVTLLLAPFDFITVFLNIASPLRLLLFALIVMLLVSLLIFTLFFPTWRIIMAFCDLVLPICLTMGVVMLMNDFASSCANTSSVGVIVYVMVVLGGLWVVGRVVFALIKMIRSPKIPWYTTSAMKLSAIFYSRLSKDKDEEYLNAAAQDAQRELYQQDVAINFKLYTRRRRLLDLLMAGILMIMLLIVIWGISISTMFEGLMDIDNLAAFSFFVNIFLIGFFIFVVVKTGLSIIYMINLAPNIFTWLRRMLFKLGIMITGFVMMPVLNMILNTTNTEPTYCKPYQYYDYQTNQTTFLDYFTKRDVGCQNCTATSFWNIRQCYEICFFNSTFGFLHASDSVFVSEEEISNVYVYPISFLEVFFLVIFLQLIRSIFTKTENVLEFLPGPSQSVETKFISLVFQAKSTGSYMFSSYRYKQAFYYFNFNQSKQFVMFFTSLLPIFPAPDVRELSDILIPLLFSATSLAISITAMFSSPYKSALHNLHNACAYMTSFLSSGMVALWFAGVDVPTSIGNLFFVLIFLVPIGTVVLSPIFVKPSRRFTPVKFELTDIVKKNKFIRSDASKRRSEDLSDLFGEDDDETRKKLEQEELDNDEGYQVADFNLRTLCPIHVQRGIDDKVKDYAKSIDEIYKKVDVSAEEFRMAAFEMTSLADVLLDTVSYQGLLTVLEISLLATALCAGWGLGGGASAYVKQNGYAALKCDWTDEELIPNNELYERRS